MYIGTAVWLVRTIPANLFCRERSFVTRGDDVPPPYRQPPARLVFSPPRRYGRITNTTLLETLQRSAEGIHVYSSLML